jgi:excisionase family DNA binding protein
MSKARQEGVATAAGPPAKEGASAAGKAGRVEVRIDGAPVEVSPELEAAVRQALEGSRRPAPEEMTTTQAADFLDVSRPFVIKLIDRGELPCRMVGKHRRVPTKALVEYRQKMFVQARKAADEMAQTSQSLGLYEPDEQPPKPR